MKIKVRQWGNSLAVRIPKIFAMQLGIESGGELDLETENNTLILSQPSQDLDDLLNQITPENLHGEISTGSPVGKEVW